MRRQSIPTVILAAFLLASCADESGGSGWTVATDTAGGTLRVINTPPESGPAPTLIAQEDLRVGTVSEGGPQSFGLIRQIAVLPDGRIAVADAQAEEVRLFDRDGRHLRTFGGEGAGPGELDGMQGVHVDRDGMLRVAEQGNARLSVFHPDSGYVTSWPLRLFSYGFRGPWDAAIDSAGRTLVASSGQYGQGRFWSMLRVYDAAMRQLDSIPYEEYTNRLDDDMPGAWLIDLGGGSSTWAPVPFFAAAAQVLDPSAEFWTSAEGQPDLEVARWTPAGDTSLVLISRRQPEPVTREERDSAMSALRDRFAERLGTAPGLDPSKVPATKPPLYGLSLDDRDRLWVRISEPAADTAVYDVFERDGRHAETVRMPFRVDGNVPPVVRGDTVWAVVVDELDVQFVVRAPLHPFAERDAS